MTKLTDSALLSTVMVKIYSIATLILVFVATATLIIKTSQQSELNTNLNEQSSTETQNIQLSALAIEGKDIFIQEGCINCHSEKAHNISLVLAGALFTPQFPFYDSMMNELQLQAYLTGQEPKKQTFSSKNDGDEDTQEYLVHNPQFKFLEQKMLTGSHTQAKMLFNSQTDYTREILVQASQTTAGISQLDALITYLQETSTTKASQKVTPL